MHQITRWSHAGTVAAALLLLAGAACGGRDRADRADTAAAGGAVTTTTTTEALRVSEVELGKRLTPDKRVAEDTDDFRARDTVYASVATTGTATSATLTARWTYQDGQLVDSTSQTIAPTGPAVTEFHISKPDGLPKGKYKVTVLLDGTEVGTEEFEVGG